VCLRRFARIASAVPGRCDAIDGPIAVLRRPTTWRSAAREARPLLGRVRPQRRGLMHAPWRTATEPGRSTALANGACVIARGRHEHRPTRTRRCTRALPQDQETRQLERRAQDMDQGGRSGERRTPWARRRREGEGEHRYGGARVACGKPTRWPRVLRPPSCDEREAGHERTSNGTPR
jgi:hypothetical protein